METENAIIRGYAGAIFATSEDAVNYTVGLGEDLEQNKAIIATLNVVLEAIRSHTVLLQQALDNYK